MGELLPGETLSLGGAGSATANPAHKGGFNLGPTATVTSSRVERLATPVRVYNFEVADWHTYHVGDASGWVWVHNRCNGNKLRSGRAQHGYEIVDRNTGKVIKTGVSGGKLTDTGGILHSARADRQVAKWNKAAQAAGDHGPAGRYYARVVHQEAAGPWARKRILAWERQHATRLKEQGQLQDRDFHRRP